jgi:putative exosortase-associated protein (TIGR04073 family)
MKKLVALLIVISLGFCVPAHAIVETIEKATAGPIEKLGRGVANVVTCPLELIKGMDDVKQESGLFAAVTWGILQGTFNIVKRAVVGVYEIVTFPVPLPKDYAPILTDPEFFWEKK